MRNIKEFVEYVKANSGRLSYGAAGQGSLSHLTMELFKQQINSFMVHIPYRGVALAFTGLMGGQTQAMFPGLATVLKSPDLRDKLSIEVIEPITMTPDEFGAFIKAEIVRWTAFAKARNIQLDR